MSRRETMVEPKWRAQVVRVDGTVRAEFLSKDGAGADCRKWFGLVTLEPDEHVLFQIRRAGSSRYLTIGRRP